MIVRIFLFHRISPVRDVLWDPIDPDHFENILKYIIKKYSVLQLEDFFLNRYNQKFKKPIACIVFDDGYKDFINYALPILYKHKCPTSLYIVTECADKNIPPWTYVLDYMFLKI